LEQAYRKGLADGAESLLASQLPSDMIIPEITAEEAMRTGVDVLRARGLPLLGANEVYEELASALNDKRPFAFVRLGDGELLTLAQGKTLTVEEVRTAGYFLHYAGIIVPNLAARDELAATIRVASLVGVPMSRHSNYQPLLFRVFRDHGIDFRSIRYTTSTMNYHLHEIGMLQQLLKGRRLLLIGNVANALARKLKEQGYKVSGVITPVNGYADVKRVVDEAAKQTFDLALVSAGIPAIPIAVQLAGRTGKVCIDFGHLANRIAGLMPPSR
jgi:hypothetical protein